MTGSTTSMGLNGKDMSFLIKEIFLGTEENIGTKKEYKFCTALTILCPQNSKLNTHKYIQFLI